MLPPIVDLVLFGYLVNVKMNVQDHDQVSKKQLSDENIVKTVFVFVCYHFSFNSCNVCTF